MWFTANLYITAMTVNYYLSSRYKLLCNNVKQYSVKGKKKKKAQTTIEGNVTDYWI